MTIKILTFIFGLSLVVSDSFAQATYSESEPFKPGGFTKEDKKKKSDKKTADVGEDPAVPDLINVSESITIPISVFDRTGKFISGLTKDEVSVFVDGREVSPMSFEKTTEPVSVVLVLDTSPSAAFRLEVLKEQAWKLVQALPGNAKVMVVEFNSEMKVLSQMSEDRARTKAAIATAKMGGGTSLYSAIRTLYQKVLPTIPRRKVILLLTDGVDTTSSKSSYGNSLSEVERGDVSVYPVYYDTSRDTPKGMSLGQFQIPPGLFPSSLGRGNSEAEYKRGHTYLTDLAAASGGRMFSSEKLEAGTRSLVEEVTSKYYATITVPKTGVGRRQVRVRVKRPGLAVFARGSFIDY